MGKSVTLNQNTELVFVINDIAFSIIDSKVDSSDVKTTVKVFDSL
jgi:hypothetical protein